MATHFRKSKKVGPVRFTLSERGLSTSVGAGPFRISRGVDGRTRRTVRIPGTGLYDTRTTRLVDAAPASGEAYPDGTEWGSPPTKPPAGNRALIIGASIVGAILLLILLGNCDGNKQDSVGSTVTKTVTTTAQPPTVTVTAQPPAVTVTAEPSTVTEAAPPPALFDPQETSTFEAAPPLTSSVYYANCSEARAAGAAPLHVGEPGYRAGLDRDSDGVACES
jgi:hypothetical protein